MDINCKNPDSQLVTLSETTTFIDLDYEGNIIISKNCKRQKTTK